MELDGHRACAGPAAAAAGVGAAGGAWLAACHYRSLLDTANTGLATAKQSRDNLETLADEQGRKLGELVLAGELRGNPPIFNTRQK